MVNWARHASAAGCVFLVLVLALPFKTDDRRYSFDATPWTFGGKPYSDPSVQRHCGFQPAGCPETAVLVFLAGPVLALAAGLAVASAVGFARGWQGSRASLLAAGSACVAGAGGLFLGLGLHAMFGFSMYTGFFLDRWGAGFYVLLSTVALLILAAAAGLRAPVVKQQEVD